MMLQNSNSVEVNFKRFEIVEAETLSNSTPIYYALFYGNKYFLYKIESFN